MSKKTKGSDKTYNFRYLSLCAIILALAVVFGLLNNKFFGVSNLMNIIRQTAVIAILSIGMTFVILTGGIDLSVGSNLALGGAVGVWAYNQTGSAAVSFLAAILSCTLVGLVNGILIGQLQISAFIATLAMQSAARGLTMVITGGGAMGIENDAYYFIGQGQILGAVPVSLFLVIFLFIIFGFICGRTVLGRQFYAVGGEISRHRKPWGFV